MNQKTVVHLLSEGDNRKFQRISDLILEDQLFAEILDEYIIATNALEKWIQVDGMDGLRTNQYRDLIKEREQEMREILQRRGIIHDRDR